MLNIFRNTNKQELVLKNNNSIKLLDNNNNNFVNKLETHFTQEEQQLYVGNLYMYMNYHPTNDYPINLENVFKMIGFANKENAKRTLKNNFTEGEDYKILLVRTDEQVLHGGHNKGTVMLNVDTFKNLCMLAKTNKGKVIRKYYVKLESVYNEIVKEQLEQRELEHQQQLQAKEQELLRYKEKTYEEIEKTGHIYVIKTDGGTKVGKTKDAVNKRIRGLQTGNVNNIEILLDFRTSNPDLLEKCAHYILDRYRCNSNREFFDCDINYIKTIVEVCGNVINTLKSTYQHISKGELVEKLKNNGIEIEETILNKDAIGCNQENNDFYNWLEENVIYKRGSILKLQDTIEIYIGKKISTRQLGKYRKEIEKYIKDKLKNIEWEYKQFWIGETKHKGWQNLEIIEK